jgi:hypothetical protein
MGLSFANSIVTHLWPIAKLESLAFLLLFCENTNDLIKTRNENRDTMTIFEG